MANRKLGIDVEIKYPTANQIKDSINKEWQSVKGDFDIKVNVSPDKNSMASFRKRIKDFLKDEDFEFKLRLDTTKALSDLQEIRKEFRTFRKEAEEEIEFKFTGIKEQSKNLKEVNENVQKTTKTQQKSDSDRMARLREIMSVQRELNSLQTKKVSASSQEQAVYNKRIEELSGHLKQVKSDYQQTFGTSADSEWMVQNVQRAGEFNIELRETQKTQKETNELVKQYTGLLNDEFRIQKELQTAGEGQTKVLEEQLSKVRLKRGELLKAHDLEERMSDSQKQAITSMIQQNDYQQKLTQAKREDKELADRQNATYKELKSDMNEIHKIQMKITELQAKYDAGVATAREEDTLNSLKMQLIAREDMYKTSKDIASAEGLITKEAEDGLGILQKQQSEKLLIAEGTAKINADLKVTNNLYDDLMSSVRRVQSLTRDMANAGSKEADVIRKTIKAEEDKQAEIRETLKEQNRVNDAREEEYATMKKLNSEQEELSSERSRAKEQDIYSQNSIIGMLDPRTVYNEGKRAAMAVYSVVAELDAQIVDIEKVADASELEMNRFKENVFDFASDVGKSADEYSESVERWVTQGFTLAEGMELARESTMGAFVGNINEVDMVDYMSVPLTAYKDTVLETSDILNVMNEVANNNAVEMDILGEAYKRAAQTASNSGTSFTELTGLITGAQEATRFGGEVIGTSLRAIDLNFSKIGAGLTKSDITKSDFFESIGVNINDANGELRSTFDIIQDLEKVWGQLSSHERSTASIYSGGSRHATVLQGIIKGWDKVVKSTGEAEEQMSLIDKKSGSAYKEFEVQTNSVEYATVGLKNAWAELLHQIASRDEVIEIIDYLRGLVEVGTELAQNEGFMNFAKGFLKAALWTSAAIGANKLFTAFSKGIKDILLLGKDGINLFANFFGKADEVKKIGDMFTVAGGSLSGLVGIFAKFLPVIGLTVGALALLKLGGVDVVDVFKSMMDGTIMLSEATKNFEKTQKEASRTISENSLINNEFDDVDELLRKYRKINQEKEEAFRNSEDKDAKITYNKDEFVELRDAFNAEAENLDIDLKIEFNDYNHIKAQLEELQQMKRDLEKKSAEELIGAIRDLNKTQSTGKSYDDSWDSIKDTYRINSNNPNDPYGAQGAKEALEIMDELGRVSESFYSQLFATDEFKKAKEARDELVTKTKEARDELVKIHKEINPYDYSTDDQKMMASNMLPAISEYKTQISHMKELSGVVSNLGEGGELSFQQFSDIVSLAPEFSTTDWRDWGEAEREAILNAITGQKELAEETSASVEERIRALYTAAGVTKEEQDRYLEGMKGSASEMVDVLVTMGDTGRLFLEVSEEAIGVFGEEWGEVATRMQNDIEKLDTDVVTKYDLVTDDGFFDWGIIDILLAMPDEIKTEYNLFDNDGLPVLENIINLLDDIPDKKGTTVLVDEDGNLSIDKVLEFLDSPDTKNIDILTDDSAWSNTHNKIMGEANEVEVRNPVVAIGANAQDYANKSKDVKEDIDKLDNEEATPLFKADTKEIDYSTSVLDQKMELMDGVIVTTEFAGNTSQIEDAYKKEEEERNQERNVFVNFFANISQNLSDWWSKTFGSKSKSISIDMDAKSVAITEPQIGGALSRGVSQSVGVSNSTSSSYRGNPRYDNSTPAKVDSDVWRYWAKELYKGIPLEDSMDKLNKSIQNASEDNRKLISLYRQQNNLTKQQIKYEQDMKKAQQAEMNSILAQLRKQGFRTSGNQITNLGISKNMSGEKAERSSELLNQYNSLYRAINSTNDNIRQLNQDIISNNKSIKDAQEAIKVAQEEEKERLRQEAIEKELKAIEKSVKRAEGLLTNIQNDMSIFSTKMGLISDLDYELKLSVSEEGVNKASQNVKNLTDEFNRLSQTTVEYEENVDTIQSELESLKSEILSNADSILAYRDAIKELEIQRMVNDFDKFANAMDSNLGRITNNIDNLRDGLVSGQSLSDLVSSSLMGVDFNRKTQIEREYQQRLELERELNEALDAFAKKNIDRVKNVANATLTVEKNKYSELLKLANGFSNGKVENVSISSPSATIGSTSADSSKDKSYQAWLDNLVKINNSYTVAYSEMVSKYDDAIKKATTASEKELITNAMIIEQLQLQEDIYQSMIDSNNTAIKNTEEMLKDSSLTTEQRQQLLDNIEEYRQSNIDSQNSIKNSIQSRFDLEFEMIDEAISRAEKYTSEISNMMDIAKALGSGDDVINEMYRALYESKINEYAKATDIIEDLTKQQSKFEEGSFEWNILQEKILETQDSLSGLTIDILNANKEILSSQLDIIQEANEKLALGTSASNYDRYKNAWMDGVEKELELERLRMAMAGVEDKTLQGKLELMDRQEKVSRAELEYVNKQLEAVRLQEKLENLRDERNIQTLVKDADGNWQWEYVADQSEYDSTKGELDDLRLEIEKYREEQRRNYVTEMNDIISRIKDGEFKDVAELEGAIADVNEMFDDILGDIDDMSLYDTASIIKAYQEYLANNEDIISGINSDKGFSDKMAEVGSTFEKAFINVTSDLSKLIADELRNALNMTPVKGEGNIIIEKQVLEFPNITDSNGLKDAIAELPQIAKQISSTK